MAGLSGAIYRPNHHQYPKRNSCKSLCFGYHFLNCPSATGIAKGAIGAIAKNN